MLEALPLSYYILFYLVNLCYGWNIKLQHIYHHNLYAKVQKCILKTSKSYYYYFNYFFYNRQPIRFIIILTIYLLDTIKYKGGVPAAVAVVVVVPPLLLPLPPLLPPLP